MAKKPIRVILRTYQVGFGDCFLLTFQYAGNEERHVLIDFGSTGMPSFSPPDQMLRVANNIKLRCGGELDVVVATHRHKDHISGFATNKEKTDSGNVIRDCNPKVIIQPWTEDPELAEDATSRQERLTNGAAAGQNLQKSYFNSLLNMNRVANNALKEAQHFSDSNKFVSTLSKTVANQLKFLADDNGYYAAAGTKPKAKGKPIANISAVENLNTMEGKRLYVQYGSKLNLATLLPGVNVRVLGPPTIEQYNKVVKQKSVDKEEFWMLYAATSDAGGAFIDEEASLFPGAKLYDEGYIPSHARWFVRNLRAMRGEQLLQIARTMDQAMNNTSVILLFEVGKEKLLFPGDAQIENWEYALKHVPEFKQNLRLLEQTTLYKVGHHGSRNATPKTLWNCFAKKGEDKDPKDRLCSIVSTMEGKHGHTPETAVPRGTLVEALDSSSNYYTTQEIGDATFGATNRFVREEPGLWGEVEMIL